MSYATIDALRSQLGSRAPVKPAAVDPSYAAKMLHPLPEGKEVDRAAFILERVTGKRVLEFGASGPMHEAVVTVAASVYGVDRESADGVVGFDLDNVAVAQLPPVGMHARGECTCSVNGDPTETVMPRTDHVFDVILCGEVLEHLSNPGWFLMRLHRQYAGVPVLITVPNAFTVTGRAHLTRGLENVNIDHVAWYSPRTLQTLLERAGYRIVEFAWYGGAPPYANGVIVIAETIGGQP